MKHIAIILLKDTKVKLIIKVAIIVAIANVAFGQESLSPNEIQQAINGAGKRHSAFLIDISGSFGRAMLGSAAGRSANITLLMPEAVLATRAESARKQFLQYRPTEEETHRALTVFAEGWVGEKPTDGCVSITRIVLLSDKSGTVVKEAYQSAPADQTWSNNFGASISCQNLVARFTLDDVQQVKAAAPNGEFFVAVFSGEVNSKMYKIKQKFQKSLTLIN